MSSSDAEPAPFRRVLALLILGGVALLIVGSLLAELAEARGASSYARLLAERLSLAGALLAPLGVVLWLIRPGAAKEGSLEPELWLCPNCFTAYVPDAHFCPECGAPVDEFAGRGGYEQIYASAWILGKAARAPWRALHVVGVALVAAPTLISWAVLLQGGWSLDAWDQVVGLGFAALSTLLYVALIVMAVRSWIGGRRETDYGVPPWWTYDASWGVIPGPGRGPEPATASDAPAT